METDVRTNFPVYTLNGLYEEFQAEEGSKAGVIKGELWRRNLDTDYLIFENSSESKNVLEALERAYRKHVSDQ